MNTTQRLIRFIMKTRNSIKTILMKNSIFIIYLIAVLTLSACENDNPVILTINNFSIQKRDFNELVLKKKNDFEIRNKQKFTKKQFENWFDSFINNKLYEQEAEKYNYHIDSLVLFKASIIEKMILGQPDAEFYGEWIKKQVTISEEEYQEGRENLPYIYTIEYISYDPKSTEHLKSVSDLKDYEILKHDTIIDKWPFEQLIGLKNSILKINDATYNGPFILQNNPYKKEFVFIKILRTEYDSQALIDNKYIDNILGSYKRTELYHNYFYNFTAESEFRIDSALTASVYNNINYINENSGIIDTLLLQQFLEYPILEFSLNQNKYRWTVRKFIFFLNNLPLRGPFESQVDFSEYLQDVMLYEYIYDQASKLGFNKTKNYTYNNNQLIKKVAVQKYLNETIGTCLEIADDEIEKYYNENTSQHTLPETIYYDTYSFADYKTAIELKDLIPEFADSLRGRILEIKRNESFHFDSTGAIGTSNPNLIALLNNEKTLINAQDNQVSVVCKTAEKGEVVIPLEMMKDNIRETLQKLLSEKKEKELLLTLKSKSNIQHSIEYKDYIY